MRRGIDKTNLGTADKRQPLTDHEWKFDDVPNDQLEACYLYEYAREFFKSSKHLQKFQKEWNDPANKQHGKYLMALHKAWDLLRTRCKNFPYVDFEFFPCVTWQDLPAAWPRGGGTVDLRLDMTERVNEWSARERKCHSDRLHIEALRQCEPANILTLEAFEEYHKFFHEILGRQDLSKTEYGFFAINWNYSDPEIRRAFNEWLDDQRQERKKLGLSANKRVSYRGGFRDRLRWLGALRVKNHYRYKDLVDHADTNLKVDAPYSHYPDFREAAQKAEQEIEKLFPREWSEAEFWRREEQDHRRLMEAGGIRIPSM